MQIVLQIGSPNPPVFAGADRKLLNFLVQLKSPVADASRSMEGPRPSTAIVEYSRAETRYIKILTFDAGGVKCLSSLTLLEELLRDTTIEIRHAMPYNMFDLICGTQWGGVLAIMLGRLRMSIGDCKNEFSQISWNGNSLVKSLLPFHGRRNSNYFQNYFKRLVQNYTGSEDTLFYDANDDSNFPCKTAVLAFDIHDQAVPTLFRSYFTSKEPRQGQIPIWKVALAAISHPVYLIPVSLEYTQQSESREFIDASVVGYSNPSREALNEAKSIFNENSVKVLVNIGTGDRARKTTPSHLGSWFPTKVHLALVRMLEEISTDPQRVAYELERDGIGGRFYCRLSVSSGLHSVHSMSFSKNARKKINAQTRSYLELNPNIVRTIRGWSRELVDKSITLETPIEWPDELNIEPISNLTQADLMNTRTERSADIATLDWFTRLKEYVDPLFEEENEETAKIKVAILDTGIDTTHPFISKRKNSFKYCDFTKENLNCTEQQAVDLCGHGTHLAGVILRIAPHVELYIARVFESRTLSGNNAKTIAKAIKHVTEQWKVDIISMSFGFHDNDPVITEALFAAYEKNTVLLAAVSNDGNRSLHPIAFPARLPYVFCINSADGDGNKSRFNPDAPNGRGKTWKSDNFSILGENISSCWPKNLITDDQRDIEDDEGAFKVSSGSSVATAVAAAVAALVMEFGARNNIARYEKLKSFRGIQQIFTLMSGEDEIDGFKNIRPWFALNGLPWDVAHLFDKELKNP